MAQQTKTSDLPRKVSSMRLGIIDYPTFILVLGIMPIWQEATERS